MKRMSSPFTTMNITKAYIPDYQSDVYQLSNQFWSIVNPEKESVWIEVDPPSLFIYDSNAPQDVQTYVDKVRSYYLSKSLTIHYKSKVPPSLFRLFIYSIIQRIVVFLLGINIPALILWLCLIGIITWMTPKWRDQWLLPLLVRTFNKSVLAILNFIRSIHELYKVYVKDSNSKHDYDADGLHRGAITTQAIFNQKQAHVESVRVQTLSHQHVADIQNLNSNAKGSLVSCGQDGRLVLWDAEKAKWMARLDKTHSQDGILRASWNPAYSKRSRRRHQPILVSKSTNSKPICVKVDQGNRWIAAGFDDHTIRIWDLAEGKLISEMDLDHHIQIQTEELSSQTIRNRFHITEIKHQQQYQHQQQQTKHRSGDRITDIQFIGAIPEYCDPSIAEAAARCQSETNISQNCILSIHKSGLIREWDILSGECFQTIKTGHTRDITQVYVIDAKAPHRKLGVIWIFTASKDGTIKCWERRMQKTTSQWTLTYTVDQHSPITSIATEIPVGGMGILVSGSLDGTVKVWNFETGQSVCTLSSGKAQQQHHNSNSKELGGPIRHFSNFNDRLSDTESVVGSHHSESSITDKHNHRGAIHQVVVTRYCEVENGPGLCRGCDTCFGNGFLVASSAADNKVHVWRLERSEGSGHEGSCTLCTRDYHRKQYKHHKPDEGSESTARRRRSPSRPKRVSIRYNSSIKKSTNDNHHLSALVDIEQLGGVAHIELSPAFLGKIDQLGGHGLVFCDKVLAGVRRRRARKMEWEAWFAPLQYYDPTDDNNAKIPIETFSLDISEDTIPPKEDASTSFLSLFRSTTTAAAAQFTTAGTLAEAPLRYRRICVADEDDSVDHDEDEAAENLPFSIVRHVIPLDGRGLACDYGNFIKLVYIDNKLSLTEKEINKQKRIQEEEQIQEQQEDCKCSPETQGKDGCCGGVNKKKNGDACCREKKRKAKVKNDHRMKNITNCSVKYNCSRAADCAAAASAVSSSVDSSSLRQWH